jgi:hemolysin activation/secretion protein
VLFWLSLFCRLRVVALLRCCSFAAAPRAISENHNQQKKHFKTRPKMSRTHTTKHDKTHKNKPQTNNKQPTNQTAS